MLLVALASAVSCAPNADTVVEERVEQRVELNSVSEPTVVKTESTKSQPKTTPVKRKCGHMPPVDHKKIEAMLLKSSRITQAMSDEQRQSIVSEFIRNKQQGFSKKCR